MSGATEEPAKGAFLLLICKTDVMVFATEAGVTPDWEKLTRPIQVLTVLQDIAHFPNLTQGPITIEEGSLSWSFDVWVRGDFPATGPDWHYSLSEAKEGPDPSMMVPYDARTIQPTQVYVVGVNISQFAQYTLVYDNGTLKAGDVNLFPVETWFNQTSNYSRNEHNFISATPYAIVKTPSVGGTE